MKTFLRSVLTGSVMKDSSLRREVLNFYSAARGKFISKMKVVVKK